MRSKIYILILLNILIIGPILFLSFYNYPSADDFSYGAALKSKDFFEVQIERYLNWTSRYFATAVLSLSPITFGTIKYFGLYTVLFLVLNFCAFYYLFRSLKLNLIKNILLSLSLMSIYTTLLTSLSENYFWLAGSVTYYVPSIFILFFIGSIINILNKNLVLDKFILLVSIFIIGGCVEIYLGYALIILFLFIVGSKLLNNKLNSFLVLSFLILLSLVLFVVLSPGNHARSEVSHSNLSNLDLIVMSLRKVCVINIRYTLFAFVLIFTLFKILDLHIKTLKLNVFYLVSMMLLFQFIGSFVAIYSLKYYYPPRVENILVFTTIIFLVFIINNLTSFIRIKMAYVYILAVLFTVILVIIPKNEFQNLNNVVLIYDDILKNRVVNYKSQILERDLYLKSCKGDCTVKPLSEVPRSLLFKDLSEDSNNYINKAMSVYYGVNSISLKQ